MKDWLYIVIFLLIAALFGYLPTLHRIAHSDTGVGNYTEARVEVQKQRIEALIERVDVLDAIVKNIKDDGGRK